jgi:GTP pyrophosphokinase
MDELDLILRAAELAGRAHGTQTRKASRIPYVNHPLRVARAAREAGLPVEAIAAALLHDVLEDTATTEAELAREMPARVVEIVRKLTKSWPDDADAESKELGKPAYYAAIRNDAEAAAVKLLDRADNLDDMREGLPRLRDWAERYLRKTEREISAIREACRNAAACERYDRALARLEAALRNPEDAEA